MSLSADFSSKSSGFERRDSEGLVFSTVVLVFLFLIKPAVDALYDYGVVKYLYFFAFLGAFVFAYIGQCVGGRRKDTDRGFFWLKYFVLLLVYFVFLIVLGFLKGGGAAEEIIKKMTPFVALFAMASLGFFIPLRAVKWVSFFVVIANFLTLPFDYGWVYWGGVKTFKGFYYFKTDLAFSVTMALLAYYVSNGRRLSWDYAAVALMAVAMIVVSNSRLNYLLVMMVLIYSALDSGVSLKNIFKFCVVAVFAAVLVVGLYDSSKLLSPFDFDDVERFTQGRNRVWDVLIDVGVYGASWSELIFGQGLRADWILSYQFGETDRVHDAHNEVLHLLINQGFFGLLLYALLWAMPLKSLVLDRSEGHARRLCLFAVFLFFVQSLTTVLSSYYLKMWWLVLFILIGMTLLSTEARRECKG